MRITAVAEPRERRRHRPSPSSALVGHVPLAMTHSGKRECHVHVRIVCGDGGMRSKHGAVGSAPCKAFPARGKCLPPHVGRLQTWHACARCSCDVMRACLWLTKGNPGTGSIFVVCRCACASAAECMVSRPVTRLQAQARCSRRGLPACGTVPACLPGAPEHLPASHSNNHYRQNQKRSRARGQTRLGPPAVRPPTYTRPAVRFVALV